MRSLLLALWRDEAGVVLSAEAVLLGTVGVIGMTVGLSTVSEAVNDELTDLAFAIRSLDQSYCIEGRRGCGSWTAGSKFIQRPVAESLAELQGEIDAAQGESDEKPDDARKRTEMKQPDKKQGDKKEPEKRATKKPDQKKPKSRKKPKEEETALNA